ncbi:MAG: HAD-IIIC family phosphatase [Elusimicrobiota bacterium]
MSAFDDLAELRRSLASQPDYLTQTAAARKAAKILADESVRRTLQPVRLAVLGSSTTAQLPPLLILHGLAAGLALEIHEAPFGAYRQEILDPNSALYAFKPQAVLLFVNYRDAEDGPPEAEADRWAGLWKLLRERSGCAVLMNTFDSPSERPGGNLEASLPESRLARLRRLNALLAERANAGAALLVDCEHLSGVVGKERWHDARFWHHAQQAIAPAALPRYAAEVAAVLTAAFGRARKCLVLDLDNTLWGGVVGDDGVSGLEIGETPRGEAFVEFQRYLKALSRRGVLLAVCSKNDAANAREPFEKRPEMVLRLEDFSAFVANWEDKATGLRAIAKTLHLGLDALAFADDSPGERELVRRFCPEIAVVDLPEDPADYVRTLDAQRLFETVAVSSEDRGRAAHFAAEAERAALQQQAPDLASFLRGLEMRAETSPFQEADVARLAQLINKTNQFNLTTRRTTEAEVRALASDPAAWTLSVRLADRLGDYGLISAVVARKKGDAFEIENWLMSCRVLGRDVEKLVYNRLVEAARAAGAKSLVGRYVPTAKNGLVKDLFRGLGFSAESDGVWRLPAADAKLCEVAINDGSSNPSPKA